MILPVPLTTDTICVVLSGITTATVPLNGTLSMVVTLIGIVTFSPGYVVTFSMLIWAGIFDAVTLTVLFVSSP